MKKAFKKFFYFLFRFYIPDCIKGHTFFLKKIREGDIIIDVGSNQGEFKTILSSNKKDLLFSSIEFDQKFQQTTANDKTFFVNKILSDKDGEEQINFVENKKNINYFGKLWTTTHDPNWNIIESKKFSSISLKSFINLTKEKFKKKKISLMKLDIEGAELKALRSLDDSDYSYIDQITLEFHDFMFLSLKKETEEIIKIIRNKGYYFFDFSLNEKLRDVLFIKKNKLSVIERYLCLFFTSRRIKEYLKNESNFLRNYILLFYRNYHK